MNKLKRITIKQLVGTKNVLILNLLILAAILALDLIINWKIKFRMLKNGISRQFKFKELMRELIRTFLLCI
jgi:hypothetical protein